MGIVSVLALAIGLFLLLVFRFMLRMAASDFDRGDPERTALIWGSRFCLIVVVLAAVGIVDGYFYRLPNPFRGPTVGDEIPAQSAPPPPAVPPKLEPTPDPRPDMKEVREEHRQQLGEFENGPKKHEAEDPGSN